MFTGIYKVSLRPFFWTFNEGETPFNFCIAAPDCKFRNGWFFYLYLFGKRWHN